MKPNYFIIPFLVILVAASGSLITSAGLDWYETLNLPGFTPAGYVISAVWTVIFVLAAAALLLVWRDRQRLANFKTVIWLFIANALLNIFWSAIFFGWHLLGWAVLEMAILDLTTLILILLLWPQKRMASWLLVPYFLWVSFATYLAWQIWLLNR